MGEMRVHLFFFYYSLPHLTGKQGGVSEGLCGAQPPASFNHTITVLGYFNLYLDNLRILFGKMHKIWGSTKADGFGVLFCMKKAETNRIDCCEQSYRSPVRM